MSKSKSKKAADPMAELRGKAPETWTVDHVAIWLTGNGLKKHVKSFRENAIAGNHLLSLTEGDMLTLKVTSASDRARLLLSIQELRLYREADGCDRDDGTSSEARSASNSSLSYASTYSARSTGSAGSGAPSAAQSDETTIKFKEHGKEHSVLTVMRVKRKISLDRLRKRLKSELKHRYRLMHTDADGDVVEIRNSSTLHALLRDVPDGQTIAITLKRREAGVAVDEGYVLESLADAVVLSNRHGKIVYVNRATERLFGYSRKELLTHNVRMLMPAEIAANHDAFIKRYRQTGDARVVGIGREVAGKRKDGSLVTVHLTLTHSVRRGKDQFMAAMSERSSVSPTDAAAAAAAGQISPSEQPPHPVPSPGLNDRLGFSLLEALPNAAIIIDEHCSVVFANSSVTKLLGWPVADLLGKNVNVIMSGSDARNHDRFVAAYLQSGKPKVIGQPNRRVVAQRKDGSLAAISLSVSLQVVSNQRFFTGLMHEANSGTSDSTDGPSLIQQQRTLIDSLPVAAIVCDTKAIIQGFNEAASQLFGYSLVEVVGKNVKMFAPPEVSKMHDTYVQTYLRTGKSHVLGVSRDIVGVHKDGSLINFKITVTDKRGNGDERCFLAILQS